MEGSIDVSSVLKFGRLGKIEINFIEMSRQRERILEINSLVNDSLNKLVSTVSVLAGMLEGVDVSDLTASRGRYTENMDDITRGMKEQIDSYVDLNGEISSKLTRLERLVQQVLNDGRQLVNYVDENGNLVSGLTYSELAERLNLSYTPTEQYDISNLRNFISSYEGSTDSFIDANGVKYYKLKWDVTGYAAGPGIHVEYIGEYSSPYSGYVPADVVDAAADKLLVDIRSEIETALGKDEYSNLALNDNQIDSLTSLLYNTGKNPEYFLDRYVDANNGNISLYEYSTKYWVNANGERLNGLVIRRAGEHVLAEQGYDAWIEWNKAHPLGSNVSYLGL